MISPITLLISLIGLSISSPVDNLSIRHPTDVLFQRLSGEYDSTVAAAGNDLVSLTRAQAEGLITILNKFADDEDAVKFVKENTKESSCIKSLDDAISATKAASRIITESASELTSFLQTYESIKDTKDVLVLMKSSATMLRQMDALIPKLASFPLSTQCRVSPVKSLEGIEELAKIVTKLAATKAINFPAVERDYLEDSAAIVKAAATYLTAMRDSFVKFNKFCSTDSKYRAQAVATIGDLFEKTSIFLVALGRDYDITDIKNKNVKFASSLVDTMNKLDEQDVPFLSCSTSGNYKKTAEDLEDVAQLLEDIGLENLSSQLGININLAF